MPDLDLGSDTGYPDLGSSWFLLVSPGICGYIPVWCYDCFLQNHRIIVSIYGDIL